MKKFLCVSLALLLLFALPSCGDSTTFADGISVTTLGEAAVSALNDQKDYTQAGSGYLDDFFSVPDYVTEHTVLFSTEGNDINEIGIFHVTDGNAQAMATLLSKYLTDSYEQNAAWYDSYIPQETPKLRDAEVQVFGNYVLYGILSEADRTTVFDALREALTEGK
ncbi:MAG: DUF4358 domain-containing protein [Clostridia bacterium]|nr:DUF4358 domain-containing protein [Clostridia bacterium]